MPIVAEPPPDSHLQVDAIWRQRKRQVPCARALLSISPVYLQELFIHIPTTASLSLSNRVIWGADVVILTRQLLCWMTALGVFDHLSGHMLITACLESSKLLSAAATQGTGANWQDESC